MTRDADSRLAVLNDAFDRIYVLSLDRATDRHAHIESELDGVDYHFFKATDKLNLDDEQVIADGVYDDDKHHRRQRSHRSLSLGEVACSLSHRAIYEDAIEQGYESILVLEDDVEFLSGNLPAFAAACAELPEDWEFLLLGYYCERYPGISTTLKRFYYLLCHRLGLFNWDKVNRRYLDYMSMRPYSDHLWSLGKTSGGHAYALTQSTCRKFVAYHDPVYLQADRIFMYYMADHGLNAFALKEQLFIPSELAQDSSIGYATRAEKAADKGKKLIGRLGGT